MVKDDSFSDKIFTKCGENTCVSKYTSNFFSPNLVIIGFWKISDFMGEIFFTEFGENWRDSLHLMTKNVPNFVKNMGTKICDFLSERKFTKYSENSGDSLWLVTKISLDLVKILGIHQIWWRICHQQNTGSYMEINCFQNWILPC